MIRLDLMKLKPDLLLRACVATSLVVVAFKVSYVKLGVKKKYFVIRQGPEFEKKPT